jgi:hypothetical protein
MIYTQTLLGAASGGTLGTLDPWGCMAAENGLTTTTIPRIQKDAASYGVLFVTGAADQLVDTPTERASFQSLCKAGMPMQYLECQGAGHTQTTTWALPEILTFLTDRVGGKAFTPDCDVTPAVMCQGMP